MVKALRLRSIATSDSRALTDKVKKVRVVAKPVLMLIVITISKVKSQRISADKK